jgi:hypothetical protein
MTPPAQTLVKSRQGANMMRRGGILTGAFALTLMTPVLCSGQRGNAAPVRVDAVAEKIGVKGMPGAARELELGQSATTVLAEPQKIAEYGIKGMHDGARVTITCVGPNRLRVEADEMEPVSRSVTVTLVIGDDGSIVVAPERAPPKPPGA